MYRLPNPSPELRLIALTSYLPRSLAGKAHQKREIERLLAGRFDGDRVVALIDRHRTYAISPTALRSHGLLEEVIPESCRQQVHHAEYQCRQQGLVLAGEWARLQKSFSAQGLSATILKGPQLSQKIYGDVGVRHSKDLDLYVSKEQLNPVCRHLQDNGYELTPICDFVRRRYPDLLETNFDELTFIQPDTGLAVDLHWSFEGIDTFEPYEACWKHWIRNDRELAEFVYLVWHASKHFWHRLKWLGDLAALADQDQQLFGRASVLASELSLQKNLKDAVTLMAYFKMQSGTPMVVDSSSTNHLCEFVEDELEGLTSRNRVRVLINREIGRLALSTRYPVWLRVQFVLRLLCWSMSDLRFWAPPRKLLWVMPIARPFSLLIRYLPLLLKSKRARQPESPPVQ